MTLFESVELFINLLLPIDYMGLGWWVNFRAITISVVTCLIIYIAFILPFVRLVCWGIFGNSKKNKWLNRK